MRFGRNCNRFSCGIFLGNFRSEVPERNGLCLQMRFEVSVSLVWRIKKAFTLFEKQNGIHRALLLALFRIPLSFRPKRRALGVPDEHSVKKSIRGICRTVKQNYVIY